MTTWVLLAGLPGVGKSTLARALESRLGAVHRVAILDKDRVRAALFPGVLTDYTREQDDLCMRAMLEAAAYLTAQRRAEFILFDGRTFSRRRQMEGVLTAAKNAGAAWRILHLICSDEVAEARLKQADPAHPARNRDMALYTRVKQEFEPVLFPKLEVDTTGGMETKMDAVLRYLGEDALP